MTRPSSWSAPALTAWSNLIGNDAVLLNRMINGVALDPAWGVVNVATMKVLCGGG
jgi:hypothetical protein